jgi:hypothetical protein
MLAGKRLYREKSLEDAALRILEEPVPEIEEERADVPPEVEQLLLSLLAKDRDKRPGSAREVVEAIDIALRSVEEDEGTFTVAAFLTERFGPLREELTKERAEAIEVARGKSALAPILARATRSTPPTPMSSVTRLGLVVFTSAVLGAGILLGAQALNSPREGSVEAERRQRDAVGDPAAQRSGDGAGSAKRGTATGADTESSTPTVDVAGAETETETETETDTESESESESASASEAETESTTAAGGATETSAVASEAATTTTPTPRMRRVRRAPAMTAMMTTLDDWWSE